MAYERPGVYVQEGTFATNIQTTSGPTGAAFVGLADRGPTTPTLVTSWNQYTSLFGELSNSYDLGYAVYHYFANGGQTAYITRVLDSSATIAQSALTATPTGGSSADLVLLVTKSAGSWGNNLTVDYTFDPETLDNPTTTPKATKNSLFSLTVKLNSVEVERWNNLSVDPENVRYIDTVLDLYSSYVSASTVATVAAGTTLTVTGIAANDYVSTTTFTNGSEGIGSIDATDWATAVSSYETITSGLLFNLVGQTSSTIINSAINVMQARGNSMLIIDTPLTATTADQLQSAVSAYTKSSYAAVYGPALKMFDPKKTGAAAIRNTYAGGAVLGAFIRSEVTRGVAKAPAGYGLDIRNVYGLVGTLTEAQQGTVYKDSQINLFNLVPGVGVIINGSRTLARNTSDKYVTVRRSINYLKDVIKQKTAFAMFEPNDQRLWSDITVRLSSLLNAFWATGGLKGNSSTEAYYVICNSTNNTQNDIEDGRVNVTIGVALQSPAEYIVINISQWTGGSTVTTNA
jgi:phage tail sheath protein FI